MKKETNTSLISSAKNIKFQKILCRIVMILSAIIALTIGIYAIIKTSYFEITINFAGEESKLKFDNIFLNILYTIITVEFIYFCYRFILPKFNKKVLLILTLIFSLALGFWWVNYIKLKPISDQSMVIFCAEKILDNDLKAILNPGEYLNRNPHQLRMCSLFNERI